MRLVILTCILAIVAGCTTSGPSLYQGPGMTRGGRHQTRRQPAQPQRAAPTPQQPARPAQPQQQDYREVRAQLPAGLTKYANEAKAAILVAPERGLILYRKNDETPVPIASMTKMMTLLVAFDQLRRHTNISLDTRVRISRAAENVNERQIHLHAGDTHPLRKLMQAALMHSANDAAYAVAEALAPGGEIKNFVALMNSRARQLGMPTARFYNVHGLPGKIDNQASVRELVRLVEAVRQIPEVRKWAITLSGTFRHGNGQTTTMTNTNRRLLNGCRGVNGLKTGYTDRAGSCVAATCRRGSETLIAIVTGFHTTKTGRGTEKRYQLVSGLFDWGYACLEQVDAMQGTQR